MKLDIMNHGGISSGGSRTLLAAMMALACGMDTPQRRTLRLVEYEDSKHGAPWRDSRTLAKRKRKRAKRNSRKKKRGF